MKKFSVFFLISLIAVLAGCSKDKGKTGPQVVGEWTVDDFYMEGNINVDLGGINFPGEFSARAIDLDAGDLVRFNEDQTFFSLTDGYTVEYSFKALGQEMGDETRIDNFLSEGNWSKTEDTLTISQTNKSPIDFHIEALTATNLTLTMDADIKNLVENIDFSGAVPEGQIHLTLILKK